MLRDLFSLFPAYAGVIPMCQCQKDKPCSFPRICGGDPSTGKTFAQLMDFSPHMRG